MKRSGACVSARPCAPWTSWAVLPKAPWWQCSRRRACWGQSF